MKLPSRDVVWLFIKKKAKKVWEFIKQRAWYIILLVAGSFYVWHYRLEIYQLKELNAQNLIFVLWLLLLFWPLISEMEFLGIKVKKEVEKATEEVKENLAKLQVDVTELKISNSNTNTNLLGVFLDSPTQLNKTLEEVEKSEKTPQKASTTSSSKAPQEPPTTSSSKTPQESLTTSDVPSENDMLDVSEQAMYLFRVRLNLENMISRICEKTGYEGNQVLKNKLNYLFRMGFLSTETMKTISQIWTIANRGIHGEIIGTEYIDFVKKAVPIMFKKLQSDEKSLNYCVCPYCNYRGYAVFENVCPRCGNTHDDD